MFVVESLIDGSMLAADDWDDAWRDARLWLCHGGNPEGDVLVHETTRFDPSTFRSEFEPGRKQSATDRRKVAAYLAALEPDYDD